MMLLLVSLGLLMTLFLLSLAILTERNRAVAIPPFFQIKTQVNSDSAIY